MVAILFIIVIALAGLGKVVVKALGGEESIDSIRPDRLVFPVMSRAAARRREAFTAFARARFQLPPC